MLFPSCMMPNKQFSLIDLDFVSWPTTYILRGAYNEKKGGN
jgi:hypothetical protein